MLVGAAAALLMLTHGRIMGATGIVAGLFTAASTSDRLWRLALLAGMATGPLAFLLLSGALPTVTVTAHPSTLILGGLLVGIGVTYGSGCTSGHGVCGLARISPRSIAATLTFSVATALTVYLSRHVVGV